MDFLEINPLWRLADPLSVEEAAALIAGVDPTSVDSSGDYFRDTETGLTYSSGINLVRTAFSALVKAINAGKLKAQLRYSAEPRYTAGIDNLHERGYWRGEDVADVKDLIGESYVIGAVPSWALTTVDRADLVVWLERAGTRTGFFFPNATDAPDYLDPKNPRYAPKLAAAVRAWQAMEDENLRRGKRAYTAMVHWLESRYSELGLVHKQDNPKNKTKAGDMNKTAIEEAAKVANWEDGGGAPKTPGE